MKIARSQVLWWLCCILACIIPWHERWNSIVIAALVLFYLFDKNILTKLKIAFSNKYVLLCLALPVLYAIGITYTDLMPEAMATMERKLPLIIFPIIFASESFDSELKWNNIFKWFVKSVCFSCLYCLIKMSYVASLPSVIFRKELFMYELLSSPLMHPGYFSNYVFMGIIILALPILGIQLPWLFSKKLQISMLSFLVLFLILLTSKTAYIVFALFFIWFLWQAWQRLSSAKLKWQLLISSIATVAIFVLMLVKLFPGRFQFKNEIAITNPKEVSFSNSVGSRQAAYKVGLGLIKQRWLSGYGTGMSNAVLLSELTSQGYEQLVAKNMHTHNQMIKTSMEVGVVGTIIILFILAFWFWYGATSQNKLLMWLAILSLINCLTDDMWDIQAGIVFFFFFGSFLLLNPNYNKIEKLM